MSRWPRWAIGLLCSVMAVGLRLPESAASEAEEASPTGNAGVGSALTLSDYLSEVFWRQPQLLASQHEVSAAQASVLAAEGAFDLELYASGNHFPLGKYERTQAQVGLAQPTRMWGTELWAKYQNGADYPPYEGGSVTSDWGKISAGILLPLLQNGAIDARRYRLAETKIQRDVAEHNLRQKMSDLLAEAAQSWWRWCILGHKARIYETLLRQAVERQNMLEELAAAGLLAKVEAVDNRRTILARRVDHTTIRAEFMAAGIQVGLYRRDTSGAPRRATSAELPELPAAEPPPPLEWSRLEDELEQTPMASAYRSMLQLVEQELGLARNQQLPRLNLQLVASHSAGDPRSYSPVSSSVSETTLGGKLELGLDVQRRKARGKARALRAKRSQVQEELRGAKDILRADVLSAHQVLQAQYQAVEQSRAATGLAKEVAQAEAESLLEGQSTVMSVNIREQAVLTAQLAELQALHSLQSAWIEMQRARGRSNPLEFTMPLQSQGVSGQEQ